MVFLLMIPPDRFTLSLRWRQIGKKEGKVTGSKHNERRPQILIVQLQRRLSERFMPDAYFRFIIISTYTCTCMR